MAQPLLRPSPAALPGCAFPSKDRSFDSLPVTLAAHAQIVPNSELLERLSWNGHGDLAEVPFALLLRALAEHDRTGTLIIRKGPLEKKIVIENGFPVDCQSNLMHERLGRFLAAQGRLSETDLAISLSEASVAKLPLGQILIRRGLIGPSELYRVLQQNLAKKLLDGFSWHSGEYHFSSDLLNVESPLKVRIHQLILTGVTRFAEQERIDFMVMSLLGQKLALHPAPPVDPSSLRLSASQRLVIEQLRKGPCEMSKLASAARLELHELSRLVYAYVTLGFVGPRDEVASAQPSAATTQALRLPLILRSEAQEHTLPADELVQAFLAHRRKDAFELLDCSEEVTPREIEIAFMEFARRHAPWAYVDEGLRDKAGDIFFAGARAFAVLSDRVQRENLVAKRRNARQLEEDRSANLEADDEKAPAKASGMQIKTDLLDPEVQFQKGLEHMNQGNPREALQLFDFAADCDPQNGLYRSEAAFCRYLLEPGRAEAALAALAEARRIDPRCGEAWYYAGEVLAGLDRHEEAETMLKNAIKPMAPDRRPIDALKELTRKRSRKRRR
jgi:tetratricopeptide (TPR) repeat protein